MTTLTLHELNLHLFAAMLPGTHAAPVAAPVADTGAPAVTLAQLADAVHAELLTELPHVEQPAPPVAKPAAKRAAKAAKADAHVEQPAPPAAPTYTAEQLEILAAAGIDDPAAADPQAVAAILGS